LKHLANKVAAFLKAEEVPRWFGLSLMLIYLIGLATVANVGIQQARQESARTFRESTQYALELLADDLARSYAAVTDEPNRRLVFQRALHDFAAHTPVQMLRVVDRNDVMYSLDPDEVGTASNFFEEAGRHPAASTESSDRWRTSGARFDQQSLVRVPIKPLDATPAAQVDLGHAAMKDDAVAAAEASPETLLESGTPELYLEARIAGTSPGAGHVSNYAGALSIVLVVLGALFVTYRCLREQMRSVSRIAQRLESHRDRIQDELVSLRITDTVDLDGVTQAWNELVELTQSLLDKVERNDADEELTRVLQASSCNALGDALHVIPDGVIYICDERRIEYANVAACRLMGWNQEQVAGGIIGETKADGVGARILALVQESLQSNGTYVPRAEVLETHEGNDQGGSSFRVWIMPVRRQRAQGECVVLIRDVSQQVRAEKAREEFVTQVTHELRTPLTNIRAYAETLSSGMFDDPKVITECYNVIMKETRRLSRLIEDMLSVSQLEVGSINLSSTTSI
jgi:signal transduction histidine kinase